MVSRYDIRYMGLGLATLFTAIGYHHPEYNFLGVSEELWKSLMMTLVTIFGAGFGVSLALFWNKGRPA